VRTSTEPTTKVTVKRFPAFGVLLGAFTLVVECWTIVGLIRIDGSFSLPDLLVALVALVALFGGLDFLLQIFLPGMGLAVGVALPIELPRPVARQKARDEIDPSTGAVLKALGYIR